MTNETTTPTLPVEQFTVLVARPDYVANDNLDTFMAHVTTASVAAAQKEARAQAAAADEEEYPEDYAILLVVRGHHFDIQVQD